MSMSIEIKQAIGTGTTVTISADKIKEAVELAAFFGDLPSRCGKCDCTELTFTVRRPETYVYYGMRCKKCLAEFSFGQHKEGGGLFPKFSDGWKTFDERMNKRDDSGGSAPPSRGGPPPPRGRAPARPYEGGASSGKDDDIPF